MDRILNRVKGRVQGEGDFGIVAFGDQEEVIKQKKILVPFTRGPKCAIHQMRTFAPCNANFCPNYGAKVRI